MKSNAMSAVVAILMCEVCMVHMVQARTYTAIKEKEYRRDSRMTSYTYLLSHFILVMLLTGLYRICDQCIISPVFCRSTNFIRELDQKLSIFYG